MITLKVNERYILHKYPEGNPSYPFSIGSQSTIQYTLSIKRTKCKTINVRKLDIVYSR